MELSLTSAFSTGGLVGHAAYVLLILSMMMRRMVWLRIFVIASALIGIAYSVIWLKDPVSSFWETLLVTVNVVQLLITWRQNSSARFKPEERAFAERRLRGLSPGAQRQLINAGQWQQVAAGAVLTREHERPSHLYYISEGEAEVTLDGSVLAKCGPGAYVGEMSLVGGTDASATVLVSVPARIWSISREALDQLDRKHPTWLAVLEAGIARDMRRKIVLQNESIAAQPL